VHKPYITSPSNPNIGRAPTQHLPANPHRPPSNVATAPSHHPHPLPGRVTPKPPRQTGKLPGTYVTPRKPLPLNMGNARLPANRINMAGLNSNRNKLGAAVLSLAPPNSPLGAAAGATLSAALMGRTPRTAHVPAYLGTIVQTAPPPALDLARAVSSGLSAPTRSATFSLDFSKLSDAISSVGMGEGGRSWVGDQLEMAGVGEEYIDQVDDALVSGDMEQIDEQLVNIGAGPSFRRRVANMVGVQQAWDNFRAMNENGVAAQDLQGAMEGVVSQLEEATRVGNLPAVGNPIVSEEFPVVLSNPKETTMPIAFLLDGGELTLQPGQCLKLRAGKLYDVIFDRGGEFGESGFTLHGGRYDFEVGDAGVQLFKQ
jgi:hypothetical protein